MYFLGGIFLYFLRNRFMELTVFEIKVLICAPAGCKDPQNCAPGHLVMCFSL